MFRAVLVFGLALVSFQAGCKRVDRTPKTEMLHEALSNASIVFVARKSEKQWRVGEIFWSADPKQQDIVIGEPISLLSERGLLAKFDPATARLIIRLNDPPQDGVYLQNELTVNPQSGYVGAYRMRIGDIVSILMDSKNIESVDAN